MDHTTAVAKIKIAIKDFENASNLMYEAKKPLWDEETAIKATIKEGQDNSIARSKLEALEIRKETIDRRSKTITDKRIKLQELLKSLIITATELDINDIGLGGMFVERANRTKEFVR